MNDRFLLKLELAATAEQLKWRRNGQNVKFWTNARLSVMIWAHKLGASG
jgi:hypothetical protein